MTVQVQSNVLKTACVTGDFAPLQNLVANVNGYADVNGYDEKGGFLLGRFIETEPFTDRHVETLPRLIIELRANVNLPHKVTGKTALHCAASFGNMVAVKILIDNGAFVNSRDQIQSTPLTYCASFAGNSRVIEYLLSRTALIDAVTHLGRTALHFAVDTDQIENARVLLMHGANRQIRDSTGRIPLQGAQSIAMRDLFNRTIEQLRIEVQQQRTRRIEILLAKANPLQEAMENSDLVEARLLMDHPQFTTNHLEAGFRFSFRDTILNNYDFIFNLFAEKSSLNFLLPIILNDKLAEVNTLQNNITTATRDRDDLLREPDRRGPDYFDVGKGPVADQAAAIMQFQNYLQFRPYEESLRIRKLEEKNAEINDLLREVKRINRQIELLRLLQNRFNQATNLESSPPVKPISKEVAIPSIAFGKAKWEKYFGDIGVEPLLPQDILDILNGPCPFWNGKKVKDTHLLVLIPSTVNGEPFDLSCLIKIMKQPRQGYRTNLDNYDQSLEDEEKDGNFGNSSPSHWVLITKDIIPKSKKMVYNELEPLINQYTDYKLPKTLEVATAIVIHHVQTKEKLYLKYTNCEEIMPNSYPVSVAFAGVRRDRKGLHINMINNSYEECDGIGLVKLFHGDKLGLNMVLDKLKSFYIQLDSLELQKTIESRELESFIEEIQQLWTQQIENQKLDSLFIHLFCRAKDLLRKANAPQFNGQFIANTTGQKVYGTFNQFSNQMRDGTLWPQDASRSSCTANAVMFLSYALQQQSISVWKRECSPDNPKTNKINEILDEGRTRFEQIVQKRRQGHKNVLNEAEAVWDEDTIQSLKSEYAGDALHVSEIPNIEEIFFLTREKVIETLNLETDIGSETTIKFFNLFLHKIIAYLEENSLETLGVTIQCNGSTYAIALIKKENKVEFSIFDSHGCYRLNGDNNAFIYWTESLDEAASFLGNLILYQNLNLNFLATEEKQLLSDGLNQLATYLFKPRSF